MNTAIRESYLQAIELGKKYMDKKNEAHEALVARAADVRGETIGSLTHYAQQYALALRDYETIKRTLKRLQKELGNA